ncbi:EF-P 5-aminopentanol modification-associated protein YfmF [Helicovermis profundi]|uniref:Pitrilysin family protein n=1 Tax=Helicovermis profundi TaxID=3065157 RepID=A0AAU9EWM9_9FIRM|nr:pitrilysin family protein [Clostridia bacterium S502]
MIDDIKIVEISNGVRLHLMKSIKFKTNLIAINLKRPLKKEEATKNTLITRILERGTTKFPSSKEINIHLEELYGSILVADVSKHGEKHTLTFKSHFPSEKHILEKDIFKKSVDLLNELIFNPFLEETEKGIAFNKSYFEQEKENLRDEIATLVNDKTQFAVDRCIELMCENEPYSVPQYGSIEELEKITCVDLYNHYQDVLKSSNVDITVIGDIDFDEVEQIIKEKIKFNVSNLVEIPKEQIKFDISKVREYRENFKVKQGKLTIGYRVNTGFEDDLFEASTIYGIILGGGGNSKLFMNVREKESLCYYIFSKVEKFKSIMIVSAGVEFENFDRTLELIDENMKQIVEGDFTDEDLRIAKDLIVSSIDSISDFPNSFINFYYNQTLTGHKFDLVKLKEKYEKVTKEDVIKVAKRVSKDTIYYLDGENNDENRKNV